MIYSELKNYLTKVSSVETVQFFDDAIDVLDKYEVPNYMDIFENVISDDTNSDDKTILDKLLVNLRTILTYLLTMQGVQLNENVTASQVNEITDGLFMLAHYEDQASISSILDSDESTVEKVCELLTLVTPYQSDALMGMIDSAEDRFTEDFKERLVYKEEEMKEDVQLVGKQIKAYIAFKNHLSNAALYSDKLFQYVGSIGLLFEDYLRLYQLDHDKTLGTMTPEVIAKDLVALSCLSSDGCGNSLITIRKHLSTLFSDISTSTKVDIEVSKLTVEVAHAQA